PVSESDPGFVASEARLAVPAPLIIAPAPPVFAQPRPAPFGLLQTHARTPDCPGTQKTVPGAALPTTNLNHRTSKSPTVIADTGTVPTESVIANDTSVPGP